MEGNRVGVGPATEQVCIDAVDQFRSKPAKNTLILLPAGYSLVYEAMMNVAMKNAILALGLVHEDLKLLQAPEFTTAGETAAVARYIAQTFPKQQLQITLVVRWWHAKRAETLLRYFLKHNDHDYGRYYHIVVTKVRSWDVLGIVRERGAWIKHYWRKKGGYKFKSESY